MQKSHKRNKKHIFLHPLSRSSSLEHHKASNDDGKIYHCKQHEEKRDVPDGKSILRMKLLQNERVS